jgi:hypothetical protein
LDQLLACHVAQLAEALGNVAQTAAVRGRIALSDASHALN